MAANRTKELKALLVALERQGWTVTLTRRGHYRLAGPDGQLYFTGSTPSDHRAMLNLRSDLRRLGADV